MLKFSSANEALQHLADITGKSIKIANEMKDLDKHIKNLKKLFPNVMVKSGEEFDGDNSYIWTGFGESGDANYYRYKSERVLNPKLEKYLDSNNLHGDWYDPGTYMIYNN